MNSIVYTYGDCATVAVDEYVDTHVNPYLVGGDSQLTAGALATEVAHIINPEIRFTDYSDEIDKNYRFYSYPIIGHSFVIPTSNQFMEERLKEFKKLLIKEKNPFGVELIEIKKMEDLDFRFNYLNT